MSVSQSQLPCRNSRRNKCGYTYYGTPPQHSLTEQRGKAAHDCIGHEVLDLCEMLALHKNGTATFGHLFHVYETKNNKLVGLLLRAKRHGLVVFTTHENKEMLFQGQDDGVEIQLVRSAYHQIMLKTIQDREHYHDNQQQSNTETTTTKSFEWGNSLANLS